MWKYEDIEITLKDIVAWDKEGKFEPYPEQFKRVWDDKKNEEYINYFKGSKYFKQKFLFSMTPKGIYHVIDGKHRISLLLEFGKPLGVSELESFNKRKIKVSVTTGMPVGKINDAYLNNISNSIKTAELRNFCIIQENRDLLEKLVDHNFFKKCHYLGSRNDMADWEYMEILLAFLRTDFSFKWDDDILFFRNIIKALRATLPSSLKTFVIRKIPYEKDIADTAFTILSFMESVFKGKDYVCRAIDFCCMAILVIYDQTYFCRERKFSESEIQMIYDEYVRMWTELEPCVILTPLIKENLENIFMEITSIVDRVRR
jgi:hypothetical protein